MTRRRGNPKPRRGPASPPRRSDAGLPPPQPTAREGPAVPRLARAGAAALIGLFAVLASVAARDDSVTIDEFVHLPLGLHQLRTGAVAIDPINPHLPRMFAALPLQLAGVPLEPEPGRNHWAMGQRFMERNRESYHRLFVRGRLMITLLGAVLGLAIFHWATRLHGWPSGLAATGLFALSPTMLAHGHLVTLDLAGALGFLAASYATWRLLERPSRARAAALGGVLGLAVLLKLANLILLGVVPLLVAVAMMAGRSGGGEASRDGVGWAKLLGLAGIVALAVLNVGYGLEGTLAPLARARFADGGFLAALASGMPWLRVPLPSPLLQGIDLVLHEGEMGEARYFLAGELSTEGWWYYHLAAFLLKSPLPLIAGSLLAFGRWFAGRGTGRREYCVFVPILCIFAANSLWNSQYIGVRHVLPAYPLLFIAISPLLAEGLAGLRRAGDARRRAGGLVAAGMLLWFVAGSLYVAPRYLQYFNEVAGGPADGHRMLIDSNVDWGQDLLRLRSYMTDHQVERVHLAYFGRVDPAVYGIPYVPLERGARGPVAISASFLMGQPYFWFRGGTLGWVEPGAYTWLQEREPVGRAGSMFLFDLP